MKRGKTVVAFILVLSMVCGIFPISVKADNEDAIYLLAGGDFQAGDNSQEDHYYSRQHVANILSAIDDKYSAMNGFIFVGDYDGDTHDDSHAVTGIDALMDTVDNTYSNLNHDNSILIQGNHESAQVAGIDPTGGYDFDGYAVYVMNQSDYCEKQTGKSSQIQKVANDLETWLNDKLGEGYDAPIFIAAHVPLAYGTRTFTNGDGLYAKYVFDVINTAADNGLNIIFLHGHDHAYGADNYLGGEAIYLQKGDKINIAKPGENSAWTEETLSFTYMNAGYVGYYNENYYNVNSYEEEKLTMTVFKIENNQVTVERYNKDGLYNLKSAGREGFYSNASTCANIGLSYNATVYASPQTILLETVQDYGTIGSYVRVEAETAEDDVTVSNEGWVEITAPIEGTDAVPESTKYQYVLDTNGVDVKTKYLILNTSADGDGYALTNNNGTVGQTEVLISNNTILVDDETNVNWIFSDTSQGTVDNQNRYITLRRTTLSFGTSPVIMTIGNANNGEYKIYSRLNNNNYYLSYNDEWTAKRASQTNTIGNVYLFSYDTIVTTPSTPATPDINGTYRKISGDLSYHVTRDMTADEAMELVKAGIDGYSYEGMSTPGSAEQGTKVDDSTLVWEWIDTFDGKTAGDYEVKIYFESNGTQHELATAEVIVPLSASYFIAEGNGMYYVDMNESAESAMETVKAGVTVSVATDPNGTEKTVISDDEVTWKWIDTYNGADSGPYTVEILKDGTSLGTVEVKVNIKYTTQINPDWSYIGEADTTAAYTYTLDTDGIDSGSENRYIIVARDQAYLLDGGIAQNVSISSDGNTVTTTSRDYEYYFTGSDSGLITRDSTNTLYQQNWGIHTGNISDSNLDKFSNLGNGYYRLYDGDGTARSLFFDRGKWTVTETDHENAQYSVRLYKYTSVSSEVNHTYSLDTDGIEYGEEHKYIIVDDDESVVLNANSSSNGTAHSITIRGNDAIVNTRDYEYHMLQTNYNNTRYELITKDNGSQYLYQEDNGVRYGTRSSVKFQVNHHGNGIYDIHDIDGTNWYVLYNGNWTVTETKSARVRLYKYISSTAETPGEAIYAKLEGNTVYTVEQGTSAYQALMQVKEGITAYTAADAAGSDKKELADSELTFKWKNTYTSMITGSYWVEISYKGIVLGTVEVQVRPGVINNYPEYPDEGAVKVNKTATGIDFQSSGIAQVEVSASGVPMKRGSDVILMLDTSSSMTSHNVTGSTQTRAEVLEESLSNLIKQFKTPGDDGELLDIRVAIADFNGFYGDNHNTSGTSYDRDADDMMSDNIYYDANSEAKVYTGDGSLSAGAFISVEDLMDSYTLNYTSGTNYDYAMDAIYQLGTSIQSNDRDLFVIFMSDGAAMQWNYYHSQGKSSLWNNWITGAWDQADLTDTNINCTTHAYYYDELDHDGDGAVNEHRMANAIKGSPSESYEVIRKTADLGIPVGEENMYKVPGLGATMFAISFDAQADTNVTEESMDKSIETLASESDDTNQYYYKVTSAEELDNAFTVIGNAIAYAANNARFVDQMGENYDLQLSTKTYSVVEGNNTVEKTITPVIEIITYDIYTKAEADEVKEGTSGDPVTESMIGDRKGTYKIEEVVMFSADGKQAYSSLIDVDKDGTYGVVVNDDGSYKIKDTDDNILAENGLIYAKTFVYNTSSVGVAISDVSIPTGTNSDGTTSGSSNMIPSETFYWKLGTVRTTELAMRYYVYLNGSMEGLRNAGSYPTNEFAVLYYDNYLGNSSEKHTVSPVLAWKSANVSYAFYLVNEQGEIIVNQTTGQTGSFANKIAVTKPVVYKEILLNNEEQVEALEVQAISDDVLPKYYTLYDQEAVYKVTIHSNSTGAWNITKGDSVTAASTYVTQYDPNDTSAYSNELNNDIIGDDYTHTIVWFAVVWKLQAHPDTVVIDYGLPVDISVLTNDMFGELGKLAGVGPYEEGIEEITAETSMRPAFGSTYRVAYGTAAADYTTGRVRYELDSSSGMQMKSYDKFAYAVQYTGEKNAGYYYDTVTVIPATSIYYEDNYIEYSDGKIDTGKMDVVSDHGKWTQEGTVIEHATQAEDRPGQYSLPSIDADNVYGYDGIYTNCSTYSLGSAKSVVVSEANNPLKNNKDGSWPVAQFTFAGTGFDIISLTSGVTGVVNVMVYEGTNTQGRLLEDWIVDTYYGYEYKENTTVNENGESVMNGEWVVTDNPDTLYQIPIIKGEGFDYGTYTVQIIPMYSTGFDHAAKNQFTFYLDAVRIYDPVNLSTESDTVVSDAYIADKEAYQNYAEIRNLLIRANDLSAGQTQDVLDGIVFVDGYGDTDGIAEYTNAGPNNEVYLKKGQAIAFDIWATERPETLQIGVKLANGDSGVLALGNTQKGQMATREFETATDLYYPITQHIVWNAEKDTDGYYKTLYPVIITNVTPTDNSIVSLTNLKWTFAERGNIGGGPADTQAESKVLSFRTNVDNAQQIYLAVHDSLLPTPEPTVEPMPEPTVEPMPEPTSPYIDVDEDDWFFDAINDMYKYGLMTGMDSEHFAPYGKISRAQFVLILYRMEEEPKEAANNSFRDIAGDEWYADAVLWAAEHDIVSGYTNGNFGPTDEITREQMAVMLYRYAKYLGKNTQTTVDLYKYIDNEEVNEFAEAAIRWAVDLGLITGKENGTKLDPKGHTARAETAIILQRYMYLK